MTIVSAFLLPGNPLPTLHPDNAPWRPLVAACNEVGAAIRATKPDVLLIYSTQWYAVLDQLWQARAEIAGVHVDEQWHDHGDLPFRLRTDTTLAAECVARANAAGIKSKGVDYDGFPIDTGTIVATGFVDPEAKIPTLIAACNLYHDFEKTEGLGAIARDAVLAQGKRAVVLAVGGLSSNYIDHDIDLSDDHIAKSDDDAANRQFLAAITDADGAGLRMAALDYAASTGTDMGMKHIAWILGTCRNIRGADVKAYGPTYGAGAAVIEFKLA
ncbi:tRNA U-34 5-methylaminomethyl-2-thiouridine biosynthesis protein [Gimibacter soli]|uniref:tRNA U-34 5-methylaminomethyl-2-thiouridine biosynthesis protein n=1 Tax=Gimibacter soli TaxID=3024400 RepID=A0AAF0BKU5_9PROT|nr:tRNA U-34 5-methylaminomethyl-2-thiouridine biosynthesis protein [Gimibacter soli]WCL53342.1 tRNA U-34 5-methylaminomethyl-2-thiouridine biosynthesis protein [Gimibacter soli]